jgi:hypothetical protein
VTVATEVPESPSGASALTRAALTGPSSSIRVTVAELSATRRPTGALSPTVTVSSVSCSVSPRTVSETVRVETPGPNTSVVGLTPTTSLPAVAVTGVAVATTETLCPDAGA